MSAQIAHAAAPESTAAVQQIESTQPQAQGEPALAEANSPAGQEVANPSPDLSQHAAEQAELARREGAAARLRQSSTLPAGLRTRLADVVASGGSAEEAIRAVEEGLPAVLRLSGEQLARPQHPGGDVFFDGDADQLSEQQAEAIATQQLRRSGMLRGQRVRAGD
ncbi:MAG: hypothetical protein WD872_15395 [Pirellulaceae bacterium]